MTATYRFRHAPRVIHDLGGGYAIHTITLPDGAALAVAQSPACSQAVEGATVDLARVAALRVVDGWRLAAGPAA